MEFAFSAIAMAFGALALVFAAAALGRTGARRGESGVTGDRAGGAENGGAAGAANDAERRALEAKRLWDEGVAGIFGYCPEMKKRGEGE